MTVKIETGYTLPLGKHCRVMHDGVALPFTVDASGTTAVDSAIYSRNNVINGLTVDRYKANASDWTLEVVLTGGLQSVNSFCLGSSEVFSARQTIKLESYDGTSWATVASVTPENDSPIMFLFDDRVVSRFRLSGNYKNLMRYSEQFDNAVWGKSNATVTANTDTAPDGTVTADTINDAETTIFGTINQSGTYSPTVTASVYIKKDTIPRATRFPMLRLLFSGDTTVRADVRLDTSTGETSISDFDLIADGHSVTDVGDYWRVSLSATDNGGNTFVGMYIYPSVGASETWNISATATGSIVAWGAQLEVGNEATSYTSHPIPNAIISAPSIYNLMIGNALVMERPFYGDFIPSRMNRNTKIQSNQSRSGELLGRSRIKTVLNVKYSWNNLTDTWVRTNLDGPSGLIQSIENKQAYLAWRPLDRQDVDYLIESNNSSPSPIGRRDLYTYTLTGSAYSYE